MSQPCSEAGGPRDRPALESLCTQALEAGGTVTHTPPDGRPRPEVGPGPWAPCSPHARPSRPLPHRAHLHTAPAHHSPQLTHLWVWPLLHHIATTQGPSQGWGRNKGEGRSGQAYRTAGPTFKQLFPTASSLRTKTPGRSMTGKVPEPIEGHQLGTLEDPQGLAADISWCPDKLGQCIHGAPKFSHLPPLQFLSINHLYFSVSTAHNCFMLWINIRSGFTSAQDSDYRRVLLSRRQTFEGLKAWHSSVQGGAAQKSWHTEREH